MNLPLRAASAISVRVLDRIDSAQRYASTPEGRRRSFDNRVQEACRSLPAAVVFSSLIYPTCSLSFPSPAAYTYASSLPPPLTLSSRQCGQFCSGAAKQSLYLTPARRQFFSPAFKRHIQRPLDGSLHKRLREENIRRQRVNIQSLISEIARNRSGQCQF